MCQNFKIFFMWGNKKTDLETSLGDALILILALPRPATVAALRALVGPTQPENASVEDAHISRPAATADGRGTIEPVG